MEHIGCFSGGKDSTALMLWMSENIGVPGVDWTPAMWDTKWEHPLTYGHAAYIDRELLHGTMLVRTSEKYPNGFQQLCAERGRFPSVRARFCTQELKVFVQHEYIQTLDDEVTIYQGIRADESLSRSAMNAEEWSDEAGGYAIRRPLLKWTAEQVFAAHKEHGIEPNPLYRLGHSRVGCFPCIMTGLGELKRILHYTPEVKPRLIELEAYVNDQRAQKGQKWPATFFASGTIPDRFCSLHGFNEQDEPCSVPTAEDVFRYIESVDENQLPLLPARSCMSVYNLCE